MYRKYHKFNPGLNIHDIWPSTSCHYPLLMVHRSMLDANSKTLSDSSSMTPLNHLLSIIAFKDLLMLRFHLLVTRHPFICQSPHRSIDPSCHAFPSTAQQTFTLCIWFALCRSLSRCISVSTSLFISHPSIYLSVAVFTVLQGLHMSCFTALTPPHCSAVCIALLLVGMWMFTMRVHVSVRESIKLSQIANCSQSQVTG